MEMRLGSLLNRLDFLVGYFMREETGCGERAV